MNMFPNITDPINEFKTLALLYIQSQDLSNMTPEQIVDMYNEVLNRMIDHIQKDS